MIYGNRPYVSGSKVAFLCTNIGDGHESMKVILYTIPMMFGFPIRDGSPDTIYVYTYIYIYYIPCFELAHMGISTEYGNRIAHRLMLDAIDLSGIHDQLDMINLVCLATKATPNLSKISGKAIFLRAYLCVICVSGIYA